MKLPTDPSGHELAKILLRAGFAVSRHRVVVPDHKILRPGTLRQLVNDAGMTIKQLGKLR
jgi:hypothetical protein